MLGKLLPIVDILEKGRVLGLECGRVCSLSIGHVSQLSAFPDSRIMIGFLPGLHFDNHSSMKCVCQRYQMQLKWAHLHVTNSESCDVQQNQGLEIKGRKI